MYDWGVDFEWVVHEYLYNPWHLYPRVVEECYVIPYCSLSEYNDWHEQWDLEGAGSNNIEDFNDW